MSQRHKTISKLALNLPYHFFAVCFADVNVCIDKICLQLNGSENGHKSQLERILKYNIIAGILKQVISTS